MPNAFTHTWRETSVVAGPDEVEADFRMCLGTLDNPGRAALTVLPPPTEYGTYIIRAIRYCIGIYAIPLGWRGARVKRPPSSPRRVLPPRGPAEGSGPAVERIWHAQDSQGQILAMVISSTSLHPSKLFALRSEGPLNDPGSDWTGLMTEPDTVLSTNPSHTSRVGSQSGGDERTASVQSVLPSGSS